MKLALTALAVLAKRIPQLFSGLKFSKATLSGVKSFAYFSTLTTIASKFKSSFGVKVASALAQSSKSKWLTSALAGAGSFVFTQATWLGLTSLLDKIMSSNTSDEQKQLAIDSLISQKRESKMTALSRAYRAANSADDLSQSRVSNINTANDISCLVLSHRSFVDASLVWDELESSKSLTDEEKLKLISKLVLSARVVADSLTK